MEAQTLPEIDQSSTMTLAQELDRLTTDGLIKYASENFSLTVDKALDPQTIKENLLRIHSSMKNNAREMNAKSLQMTIALDLKRKRAWDAWENAKDKRTVKKPFAAYQPNPPIEVKFLFRQHPNANVEFSNTHPYGFTGKDGPNKYGFKQAPRYNLYSDEMYVLPLLLVQELRKATYTTHKPVTDPATGMQHGTIPIIRPRFMFERIITPEQELALSQIKETHDGKQAESETL